MKSENAMDAEKTKVAVGLSGGVDSSVAAALLKEGGHDVIGITMEIYDGSDPVPGSAKNACYGPDETEDVETARRVCEQLGIRFYAIDLRQEYKAHVIQYFQNEYLAGRTPNPCIVCNQKLKFGFLWQKARAAGIDFDFFATGHYARIAKSKGRFLLRKAADNEKDQTYFLYRLTQKQLSQTLFPLGEYTKGQVRKLAQSFGLETAERVESQDFIAGGDYGVFFDREDVSPGDIIDQQGRLLGKHRGIIHYTVGQRKGLGIAHSHPLYVQRIDAANNRIVVSDKESLFSESLAAADLNLMAVDRLDRPCRVKAKIRLNHNAVEATIQPLGEDRVKVTFADAQEAVTPGQSVVFYTDDLMLGGGVIEMAL